MRRKMRRQKINTANKYSILQDAYESWKGHWVGIIERSSSLLARNNDEGCSHTSMKDHQKSHHKDA